MTAGMSRRLRMLEEEYAAELASRKRIRLYWVDEEGRSTPAWTDEEDERRFPSGAVGK